MRGILWHVARKLEGILDGILMEFHMREDKNQIQQSMYIPWYLSSSFYGCSSTKLVKHQRRRIRVADRYSFALRSTTGRNEW